MDCYLALRDADQAMTSLKKVTSSTSSTYTEDAQWYLALAYLLNEQTEPAKNILSRLSNAGSSYSDKSKALLEQLK